jgi:hypothetical protein
VQIDHEVSDATHEVDLGGRAEPVMIPDFQTLASITQFDPKADVPEAHRAVLTDAVRGLVDAALGARLSLAQDRALYTDYFGSFTRALSIMTTRLTAADSAFMKLWEAYQADVNAAIDGHPFWQRVQARPSPKAQVDLPALTFRFALAEHLVVNDLSAVVDIAVPFQDAHLDNEGEAATLLAIYACYRRLLLNLKAAPVAVGLDNRSLLEITTVVMFSEFDRSPCLSAGPRPGTGHGRATSLLLAGRGTMGGTVIGAIKAGPGQGPLSALDLPIGSPLPVNARTGRPDANGAPYLLEHVFPTLMSLFDTPAASDGRFVKGPINLKVRS